MRLKQRGSNSDTSGMFLPAASAPDPAATRLRVLRLSLNTPILAIEGLPVGPARAAIALVQGPTRSFRLEVAIHSLRTDQVLFYAYEAAPEAGGLAASDFEAALSFAGGMGFLFEGDRIDGRDAVGGPDALRLWNDWVGKAAQPPRSEPQANEGGPPRRKAAQPPCSEPQANEGGPPRRKAAQPPRSEPQASGPFGRIPLTKFRYGARIREPMDREGRILCRV